MVKRRRLITQLYPSYLLLVLMVLGAIGWYATRSMRDFYISQTQQDLLHQAHLLTSQFMPLLDPVAQPELDRLCKTNGNTVPTRITVILPNGTVAGDSEVNPKTMENHGDRPEVVRAIKGDIGSAIRFSGTLQQDMFYVAVPITSKSRVQGIMRVALAAGAVDEQLRSLRMRIAMGGVVIAIIASILCLFISSRISRPLETMRQGAARFAKGDLSHRLHPPTTMELAELADAMNQMALEIEGRIDAVVRQRNETQAVLTSMVEAVVALDSKERIMTINAAAAALINCTVAQSKKRSIQEFIRSRELNQMIQTTLTGGTNAEKDITLFQNGERILNTRCSLLKDANGQHIGALLVMNDVTHLRRLENIRRDFAANVSHEIKTPLTAIQGFVETLHDGRVEDPQEAERFLSIIHKHVRRLTTIIDDLMQLSSLEQDAEAQQLNLANASIPEVINNTLQLCHSKATEKEIRIEVQSPKDLKAMMDADLMEQVLVNLLDNAIKYSPNHSRIQVLAARTETEAQITVQDQGIGIPKKHLPRLFERFYRVDKARSRKMGGTGLGLAIVKHIIQAHGGRVTVQSLQGQGSSFTLHLPIS